MLALTIPPISRKLNSQDYYFLARQHFRVEAQVILFRVP
jgi:hypothetical protein